MTRSSSKEGMFFFAFSGYMAVSLLLTVILLLAALAGMKLSFALAKAAFGGLEVYRLKPLVCDAAGFALASSGTALTQYYLASLLVYTGIDRRTLAAAVFFAGVFCGLFFWRGALLSSLGAYGFSGLTVTFSAFIGGYSGLFQKPGENPWPSAASSLFN